MQEYCLGIAFNQREQKVALIKKTKPDYQAGKLNGIGGKLEPGEDAKQAMQREFAEETSVMTYLQHWRYVMSMQGSNFKVYVYTTDLSSEQWDSLKTTTEEEVIKTDINLVNVLPHMRNLPTIIEACKINDPEMEDIVITYNV